MWRWSARWVVPIAMLMIAVAAPLASAAEHRTSTRGHHHGRSLDQRFVTFNAQSNLFEIRAGQLAQQRARSAEVKAFGQMLVTDHSAQAAQLATVAARLGLAVPAAVSREQAMILARLARLSGARFDRAFLAAQIDAHFRAITFNVAVGTDPRLHADLAELAIAGSPILVRHLRQARVLLALQD
jgi:putative membrane protein